MFAVLLDFNGTMFFDSSLHLEAWSKIYRELYPDGTAAPDAKLFCGPRNDEILKNIAPWLDPQQRELYSEKDPFWDVQFRRSLFHGNKECPEFGLCLWGYDILKVE